MRTILRLQEKQARSKNRSTTTTRALVWLLPKPSKSYLTVKEQHYNKAVDAFMTSESNIRWKATPWYCSEAFKVSYAKSLVDDWIKQLKLLSIIAESKPQSAHLAFIGGFKGKLNYFMRTIPSLGELLKPLEDVIRFNFIPAITGGHSCLDNDRILLSFQQGLVD